MHSNEDYLPSRIFSHEQQDSSFRSPNIRRINEFYREDPIVRDNQLRPSNPPVESVYSWMDSANRSRSPEIGRGIRSPMSQSPIPNYQDDYNEPMEHNQASNFMNINHKSLHIPSSSQPITQRHRSFGFNNFEDEPDSPQFTNDQYPRQNYGSNRNTEVPIFDKGVRNNSSSNDMINSRRSSSSNTLESREEELSRSVTVFGFPSGGTSYILNHFQSLGQIVQHRVTSGNWIHIQYRSKIQALNALNKNGTQIDDKVMIGVIPCNSLSVFEGEGEVLNLIGTDTRESTLNHPTIFEVEKGGSSVIYKIGRAHV